MGDPRISVCGGVGTLECGEPEGGLVPGREAVGMGALPWFGSTEEAKVMGRGEWHRRPSSKGDVSVGLCVGSGWP